MRLVSFSMSSSFLRVLIARTWRSFFSSSILSSSVRCHKFARVFEGFLMIGFKDFFLLRFAVRQARVGRVRNRILGHLRGYERAQNTRAEPECAVL